MVQPEARISRNIIKAVKERGGFAFKVHGSEHMMAGLPDIVCCYRGFFIGFETKTPTGVVSPRQRYVMQHIMGAQGIVTVPRNVADALNVLDRVDAWCAGEGDLSDDLSACFDETWRA